MCLYYICAKAFQHSCKEMAMFLPPSPSTSAQNFLCRLPATGNYGRNSALLHLLLEHTKVKSWICPQSLLDESAFITLLALISLAEMFLTITISTCRSLGLKPGHNTILRECCSNRRKNYTLFGKCIITHAPKRICRTSVCKSMTYDTSLCRKIVPIRWVN